MADKYTIPLGLFVLIIATVWAHLWQLASVPRGLYVDETSIGINALRIAESGVDEHGESWPIFFKAFGEYKNPLAIYGTALVFKFLDPSVFGLRLTSALFFFGFLAGLAALAWQLFRRPAPVLFVVGAAAFLPWFFPLSRIAFEVTSQLTVTVFALLCLYLAYHGARSTKAQLTYAFLAGALLAATVYTYSTSRLLAFASLALWGVLYWREGKARLAAGALGFLLLLIPYGVFSFTHPGALTARFHVISYIANPQLTWTQKAQTFGRNYLYHFTPDFLLLTGDTNLRHASGSTGSLYATVLSLSVVGAGAALTARSQADKGFVYFLAALGLAAPVPAALTLLDGGITTRTLVFGLIFVLFAGYGALFLARYHRVVGYLVCALLVLETGLYVFDYFAQYPDRSILWFETYNLEGALRIALQERPSQIVVSPHSHQAATNLAFYQAAVPNPANTPVVLAAPEPTPGTCLIFFTPEDEAAVNASSLAFRDLTPPDSMAKLRCY